MFDLNLVFQATHLTHNKNKRSWIHTSLFLTCIDKKTLFSARDCSSTVFIGWANTGSVSLRASLGTRCYCRGALGHTWHCRRPCRGTGHSLGQGDASQRRCTAPTRIGRTVGGRSLRGTVAPGSRSLLGDLQRGPRCQTFFSDSSSSYSRRMELQTT